MVIVTLSTSLVWGVVASLAIILLPHQDDIEFHQHLEFFKGLWTVFWQIFQGWSFTWMTSWWLVQQNLITLLLWKKFCPEWKRLDFDGRKRKCQFMVPSVTYLGYIVDSEGLHPTPEKIRAITEAPSPRNVTELKSYLGLLSYYSRFLPNISTILAPLYQLLRHDAPWHWKAKQQAAFLESKQLLTSSRLLIHFNPKFEIVLACDASSYGIGAVLAHQMPDGTEQPIAFASRTLSSAEKNYSQIEKESAMWLHCPRANY